MKDPEWFWGLGNPQDYWYKGLESNLFSSAQKLFICAHMAHVIWVREFLMLIKIKGYGKTRAIDSQSWIATKTSGKGFTRAWSARPLECKMRPSPQDYDQCGRWINYALSQLDRVLLNPCFRPKTNYSFRMAHGHPRLDFL